MQTIATDSPLNPQQEQLLKFLLGQMIPADQTLGVPGADDQTIFADVKQSLGRDENTLQMKTMRDGLDATALLVQTRELDLSQIPTEQLPTLLLEVQGSVKNFYTNLVTLATQCYYRDTRVMESLGMAPRAPFPEGFELEDGDWSLLDPVRERGPIWRKTR